MGKDFTLNTKLTVILLVFLAIGLINSAIIFFVVQHQEVNGRSINMAGRQRMLIQKMSKESFLLFLQAQSQEDLKKGISDVNKTSALFDKTLKGLISGDQEHGLMACTDKKVLLKLQEVNQLWVRFQGHINDLTAFGPGTSRGKKALEAIKTENLPLLERMNEAVMLYEKSSNANNILTFQSILLLFTLAIAFVAWFFTRKLIIKPLRQITSTLDESAEDINQASSTVATGAETIADQASNQAASIEESSASLEEITTISKQNADNITEANSLMQETQSVVEKAHSYMEHMKKSMEEISVAGQEISKIIKTIDEIAFQTNLLSLNAAVEAARAGEAGAGFAVVAEEVRNLAHRSSEAAKNTSSMIEDVVGKIEKGSELVEQSTTAFDEVANSSKKVASLTNEIVHSIQEQSHGISQINIAINEMDSVTQKNAATSEESASVARDMQNQASQLLRIVEQLATIVEGASKQKTVAATVLAAHAPEPLKKIATQKKVVSSPTKRQTKQPSKKLAPPPSEKRPAKLEGKPEEVIPFDDEEFQDF